MRTVPCQLNIFCRNGARSADARELYSYDEKKHVEPYLPPRDTVERKNGG